VRVIPGIPVDRAQLRLTVTYAVTERFSLGVEVNPLGEDAGPLANLRILDETEWRPALIVGTSSDRIGTPEGRAFYATLSKDLEQWTGLPIAPYAGAAYGDFDDEWVPIGGLRVRWSERWSSTHLFDGHNLHHIVDRELGHVTAGVLLVEQDGEYYVGVRVGASL
jgi:hypothetical protein